MLRLTTLFAVIVCAFCTAARAEMVANPQYDMWKDAGVGTSVTFVIKAEAMGMAQEITTVSTMVSKDADKIVVENKMKQTMMGQSMDMPPQKTDVPAQIDKANPQYMDPAASIADEEITVPAGKFNCKVYEKIHEEGGNKTKMKAWLSKDVPGGMVKLEMTTEGQMTSKGNGELKSIDKK